MAKINVDGCFWCAYKVNHKFSTRLECECNDFEQPILEQKEGNHAITTIQTLSVVTMRLFFM